MVSHVSADAQVTLTRQVIGSAGTQSILDNSHSISSTLGEAVVGTRQYGEKSLTQGFHQPMPKGPLGFELITTEASCPTATDGTATVMNILGCVPPYEVSWSNGTTEFVVVRLQPGLYTVTITTPDCEVTRSFAIEAGSQEACTLRFFNAFSPNGDGMNSVWRIENIDLPEFAKNEVKIFNRWGQMVWSEKNYNNTDVVWSGLTSDGLTLPDATYFYIAEIASKTFKGYVEITR